MTKKEIRFREFKMLPEAAIDHAADAIGQERRRADETTEAYAMRVFLMSRAHPALPPDFDLSAYVC